MCCGTPQLNGVLNMGFLVLDKSGICRQPTTKLKKKKKKAQLLFLPLQGWRGGDHTLNVYKTACIYMSACVFIQELSV